MYDWISDLFEEADTYGIAKEIQEDVSFFLQIQRNLFFCLRWSCGSDFKKSYGPWLFRNGIYIYT